MRLLSPSAISQQCVTGSVQLRYVPPFRSKITAVFCFLIVSVLQPVSKSEHAISVNMTATAVFSVLLFFIDFFLDENDVINFFPCEYLFIFLQQKVMFLRSFFSQYFHLRFQKQKVPLLAEKTTYFSSFFALYFRTFQYYTTISSICQLIWPYPTIVYISCLFA